MEDIERYGDYNEVDEAPGGNKNPVVFLLKGLIVLLCLLVVGIIAFRLVLFNYYPRDIKNIYFNDELTELYYSTDGEINALTQSLRAPYDDPDFASFFADNLIVIKDAGQMQLSLRYNSSIFDAIESKYGVRLDEESEDLFTFTLERVPFDKSESAYTVGELDYSATDSLMMYTYYKLVFDGVEYLGDHEPDSIRLKITLSDIPNADPYYILVYENTETYSIFGEYELSGKEVPNA
jgi:hypothetical protein